MYVAKNREFFFPLDIVTAAAKLGIAQDKLADMIRRSTRITHPNGNRRFENYLFNVEGDRVTAFGTLDEPAVQSIAKDMLCPRCDQGLMPTLIPCPICGGRGCEGCDRQGKIRVFDECAYCGGSGKVV